ncbi:MAG: hypothetical protein ACTSP4_15150 [Candidatus Hodarchaeales archaeon]
MIAKRNIDNEILSYLIDCFNYELLKEASGNAGQEPNHSYSTLVIPDFKSVFVNMKEPMEEWFDEEDDENEDQE